MISERRYRLVRKEVELYRDETEQWKQQHLLAQKCLDCEELIALSLHIFERITKLDEAIRDYVFEHRDDEVGTKALEECAELTDTWLRVSRMLEDGIHQFESDGFEVERAGEFRETVRMAESICTPDERFFASPGHAKLKAEALQAHRSGKTEEW